MQINDLVIVSPHYSIKFAGMVGIIKDIKPNEGLCLKIQFSEGGQLYGFSPEEVTKK
mgnify:CR=1 FL=1